MSSLWEAWGRRAPFAVVAMVTAVDLITGSHGRQRPAASTGGGSRQRSAATAAASPSPAALGGLPPVLLNRAFQLFPAGCNMFCGFFLECLFPMFPPHCRPSVIALQGVRIDWEKDWR